MKGADECMKLYIFLKYYFIQKYENIFPHDSDFLIPKSESYNIQAKERY